ncbi:hypothetical protein [Pseudomonas fluorescens]|uniref:hypothetical protein n=1 Tax=Pseudomonas fluorescens TaxID=294 RepID=UPI003D02C888
MDEMAVHREGKITLRENAVEDTSIKDVDTQKKCSVAGDVAYVSNIKTSRCGEKD